MNTYHICYLISKELCTGINIQAKDYISAIDLFNDLHGEKRIIYVTELLGA